MCVEIHISYGDIHIHIYTYIYMYVYIDVHTDIKDAFCLFDFSMKGLGARPIQIFKSPGFWALVTVGQFLELRARG